MRVIAGVRGGHTLRAPRGERSRPTADRVKESVFAILAPGLVDATVLDLFAGSGSLAIEALSRGAGSAVLVEKEPGAVACIRENLRTTAFESRATIMRLPVARALVLLGRQGSKFDIALMDPPYDRGLVVPALQQLAEQSLLRAGAVVVVEHSRREEIPTTVANLAKMRQEDYGDTRATFLRLTVAGPQWS